MTDCASPSLRTSSPGALVVGREKEGELATTSLEFEYLHRKTGCKLLNGGDDKSNDIIVLGTCYTMFVFFRARFCFALIGGNLTAQSTGSQGGIRSGIQIPEGEVASSPSFSRPAARVPRRTCSQASLTLATSTSKTSGLSCSKHG